MATITPIPFLTQIQEPGLSGFLCEISAQPVGFEECLACATNGATGCPMFPAAIERILATRRPADYANQLAKQAGAETGFSVTELTGCPRALSLKQQHPYLERPSALYRMMRGTGVHEFLAQSTIGETEKTLLWKFKYQGRLVAVCGTADLVETWADGRITLTDYKVTDNPPRPRRVQQCSGCEAEVDKSLVCPNCGPLGRGAVYKSVIPVQARSGHILQVNLYTLLAEKSLGATLGDPAGQVIYLAGDAPLRCPISYDREGTLNFLKLRLAALLAPDLPPILTDPQELWMCSYCPVRAICEELHGGPVGKDQLVEAEA